MSGGDAAARFPVRSEMTKHCFLFSTAIAASALGLPALAAEGLAYCPAERAVYELPSEYGLFRISFVPGLHYASTASDLYMKLERKPARWMRSSISTPACRRRVSTRRPF